MTIKDNSKNQADWCRDEFGNIDFGDKRLNRRFIEVAVGLSKRPSGTINRACGNWSSSKAAYRLFDNDSVNQEEILRVHIEKTVERISTLPQVIVVQDSCFLNYHHHRKTKGLGYIGTRGRECNAQIKGLKMHHAFAIDPVGEGIPLGFLYQKIWAQLPKTIPYAKRTTEDKDSFKWIEALRTYSGFIPSQPKLQVITVSDRESDYFEFLWECMRLNRSFIVRSKTNRKILKVKPEIGQKKVSFLFEFLRRQACIGTYSLKIPAESSTNRRRARKARAATLEIRLGTVTIDSSGMMHHMLPQDRVSHRLQPITVQAIWVKEVGAPKDVESLDWKLITDMPITTFGDALQIIHNYKKRWHAENVHHVLKSGCQIEKAHLLKAERLKKYIGLMSVIAWRIYLISRISRENKEALCTDFFSDHEWIPLYFRAHGTTIIPPQPPTLREVVHWIARLGGYLGRRHDGEPGMRSIWRGWQRLSDISEDWLILSKAA